MGSTIIPKGSTIIPKAPIAPKPIKGLNILKDPKGDPSTRIRSELHQLELFQLSSFRLKEKLVSTGSFLPPTSKRG